MSFSRARPLVLSVLILVSSAATADAQYAQCECWPGGNGQHPMYQLTVSLVELGGQFSDADRAMIEDAIDRANDFAFLSVYGSQHFVLLSSGQTGADLVIYARPSQPGNPPAFFAHEGTNNGSGGIFIPQNYLQTNWVNLSAQAFLRNVVMHELGHTLGLDDDGCGWWSSVMYHTIELGLDYDAYHDSFSPCDEYGLHVVNEDTWWFCDPEGLDQMACGWTTGYWDPIQCQCVGASPIMISFEERRITLTAPSDGVRFDLNADGHRELLSWTERNSQVGFLVLDGNENGTIDDGTELFGNFTPQPESKTKNGFLALAEFDHPENGGNGNGLIDPRDSVFVKLRIWFDKNHDGIAQSSELVSLADLGIEALGLDYRLSRKKDQFGNLFKYRARVFSRGSGGARWAVDVYLVIKEL